MVMVVVGRESNNTAQKLLGGGGGGAHLKVWRCGVGVRAGSASVHSVIGLCKERGKMTPQRRWDVYQMYSCSTVWYVDM